MVAAEDDTIVDTVRKIEDGDIAVIDCHVCDETWLPTVLIVVVQAKCTRDAASTSRRTAPALTAGRFSLVCLRRSLDDVANVHRITEPNCLGRLQRSRSG